MKSSLCKCGCGKHTNIGKTFAWGHGRKGVRLTNDTKRKIGRANSVALKGRIVPREVVEKIRKANIGQKRTEEQRARMSIAQKGHYVSDEARKNMSNAHKGKSSGRKGCHHSEETKRRLSKIGKRKWQNQKYRRKQLKAIFQNRGGITLPERRLRRGLNKLFPNEYKYVGDGQIFIGGKSPDFINVNGQKKIIELFGDFWHGKQYRRIAQNDNSTNKEHKLKRIKHFAKYGFKTLIIWQRELTNIPKLKKKLLKFHNI